MLPWKQYAKEYQSNQPRRSAPDQATLRIRLIDAHAAIDNIGRSYLLNSGHLSDVDKSSLTFAGMVDQLADRSVLRAISAKTIKSLNRHRNDVAHEGALTSQANVEVMENAVAELIESLGGARVSPPAFAPASYEAGTAYPPREEAERHSTFTPPARTRRRGLACGPALGCLVLTALSLAGAFWYLPTLRAMMAGTALGDLPRFASPTPAHGSEASSVVVGEETPTAPRENLTAGEAIECTIAWVESPSEVLAGKTRSMVWNEIIEAQVAGSGMTPSEFYDQVVARNPDLEVDGFVFVAGKTYRLPACEP